MNYRKFTYPFCYSPAPEIVQAAKNLIGTIEATPSLNDIFKEGKMLGVLMVENKEGNNDFLYGFSGLVGGKNKLEGFVPPIFDLLEPDGWFKREESEISIINQRIKESLDPISTAVMKEERRRRSNILQEWLFRQYVVLNANNERKSIFDIFAERGLVPPGGTGECAAPKLLQYAYINGMKPLAMGEFWFGDSPAKEIRRHGCFYPSCTGKCGPLLSFMLEGLDLDENPLDSDKIPGSLESENIIFEDDCILVVDKPSGMLAVPGRTLKVSLQERLQKRTGDKARIYPCHRLDMDTSGLILFAKGAENQAIVQRQFEHRTVSKSYIALLTPSSSPLPSDKGRIILPLSEDWYDRPRQMVDFDNGRQAVTDWELIDELPDGYIKVRFTPLTGRTHQLRVHAAHKLGLNRPIKGDRLYGGGKGRLCLHAATLEFNHPVTGERMSFVSIPHFSD